MFRTRRELEAQLLMSTAARRRTADHRNPSWFELIVGLAAFVAVAAGCLYAVSWLGR